STETSTSEIIGVTGRGAECGRKSGVGRRRVLPQPPPLERPPELDEVRRLAQARAGALLEAVQAVAQRVRVHVQRPRGLLDAHALVEPRAQRGLELGAYAAEV